METSRLDFSGSNAVRRGSTRRVRLKFEQPSGRLLNFTGCTAIAGFSTVLGDQRYNLTATFEEPRSRGAILLVIPADVTRMLPTGKYRWDIAITFANGDDWRALEGELHLLGGITPKPTL